MFSSRNLGISSTITVVGLVSLLVFSPFASAQSNGGGNPFEAIWAAIAALQEQIDNIEQTPGPQGQQGDDGEDGADGLNCWDLDGDRIEDPEEDINSDGQWNALDCKGPEGEQGQPGDDGNDADTSTLQAQIDELEQENEDQQELINDLLARIEALEGNGGGGGDTECGDD